jgi:hypothetical protein
MSEAFEIEIEPGSVTVRTDAFTLVFDKNHLGITSFKYNTSGAWHEGVENSRTPPTLFAPYFWTATPQVGNIYPDGGTLLSVEKLLPHYIRIKQLGFLRNKSIPQCEDYPVEVTSSLWPSGRIYCVVKASNYSPSDLLLVQHAFQISPVNDADISLVRDNPPDLGWFGFFSANLGGSSYDRSHDAVAACFSPDLDRYGSGNGVNWLFNENFLWHSGATVIQKFIIALSANQSWGDCSEGDDFQLRGDRIASDFKNPDPLNGGLTAGRVIVGSLDGGFDSEYGGYRLRAA